MVLEDFLPEMPFVKVHIYLRSADVLVSKHRLYGAQVGTALKQVRGKAMPEGVRADVLPDACLAG